MAENVSFQGKLNFGMCAMSALWQGKALTQSRATYRPTESGVVPPQSKEHREPHWINHKGTKNTKIVDFELATWNYELGTESGHQPILECQRTLPVRRVFSGGGQTPHDNEGSTCFKSGKQILSAKL